MDFEIARGLDHYNFYPNQGRAEPKGYHKITRCTQFVISVVRWYDEVEDRSFTVQNVTDHASNGVFSLWERILIAKIWNLKCYWWIFWQFGEVQGLINGFCSLRRFYTYIHARKNLNSSKKFILKKWNY